WARRFVPLPGQISGYRDAGEGEGTTSPRRSPREIGASDTSHLESQIECARKVCVVRLPDERPDDDAVSVEDVHRWRRLDPVRLDDDGVVQSVCPWGARLVPERVDP